MSLTKVPRAKKLEIAQTLHDNLAARAQTGPPEEGLDGYVVELETVITALSTKMTGTVAASAQKTATLSALDAADDDVDRWHRHIENYLRAESVRRGGVHTAAGDLHHEAFPDGLSHIDDPIADENRICREALMVLRSPDHAATLSAIELPMVWLDNFDAALAKSETLEKQVAQARTDRRTHMSGGHDAEADWVVLMKQIRQYVASRAKPTNKPRVAEGRALLAPLLDELSHQKALAAARATARATAEAVDANTGSEDVTTPATAVTTPAAPTPAAAAPSQGASTPNKG